MQEGSSQALPATTDAWYKLPIASYVWPEKWHSKQRTAGKWDDELTSLSLVFA
jgi:hypothetical protein